MNFYFIGGIQYRMGKLQQELQNLLIDNGLKIVKPPKKDFTILTDNEFITEEIDSVYKQLGGIQKEPPINFGPWDIYTENFIIELDEQLHFNKYRYATLKSMLYNNLKDFPIAAYKKYCTDYQNDCFKAGSYGGKWTNNSCEKQFGKANALGNLDGNGAPRWKQRAYYDFLKDYYCYANNIKLLRISIWDRNYISKHGVFLIDNILKIFDNGIRQKWT